MTPSDSSRPVLVERRDHVAVVTLNRPERRNTITRAMLTRLSEALRACEDDSEVRAIVVTGAGRAFSAGLDLDDASSDEGIERGGFELGPRFETRDFPPCVLLALDTPVVCALNGAAAGFGMDLALACDLRVAARSAKLAAAFVRRGVLPESGGTWLLPRLIGWGRAADVFFRGRTVGAEECLELGLVERVVDDGEALGAALEIADEIASNAPLAVQATKRMMRSGLADEFDEHVRRVYLQMLPLLGTDDFAEGVRSFLEKRPPVFRGR